MHNKVDILLATYNGERYIREQIESIINQTYSNWRLVVSDDGSQDNTLKIVDTLADRDSRITVVQSRNKIGGAAGNFFGLLSYVESPYVMFCDQDDVWDVDKISVSLDKMKCLEKRFGEKDSLLVFTDSRVVNQQLSELNSSFVSTLGYKPNSISLVQAVCGNIAQGSTMLMNHSLVERIAGNYPDFHYHDWWVFMVALATGHVGYIDRATMSYRQHENNEIGANSTTFVSWVKHLIEDPKVFRGISSRTKAIHERIAKRAKMVLLNIGDELSKEDKKAIMCLATISELSTDDKIHLYRKYKLMGSLPLRDKLYKGMGLLLI